MQTIWSVTSESENEKGSGNQILFSYYSKYTAPFTAAHFKHTPLNLKVNVYRYIYIYLNRKKYIDVYLCKC